jgi:hypothetical protein
VPPVVDEPPQIEEKLEDLKIEDPPEPKEDPDTKQKLKNEMFVRELGFSVVVDQMIKAQQKRAVPIIGHNMMYDLLYFYN